MTRYDMYTLPTHLAVQSLKYLVPALTAFALSLPVYGQLDKLYQQQQQNEKSSVASCLKDFDQASKIDRLDSGDWRVLDFAGVTKFTFINASNNRDWCYYRVEGVPSINGGVSGKPVIVEFDRIYRGRTSGGGTIQMQIKKVCRGANRYELYTDASGKQYPVKEYRMFTLSDQRVWNLPEC